jgi:hypothetical protein
MENMTVLGEISVDLELFVEFRGSFLICCTKEGDF